MTTTKMLLLGLIALSCFLILNAKVIPRNISDDFNKAVETLNKSLSHKVGGAIAIIDEIEQNMVSIALVELDILHKDMDELEINANSKLEALNVSEICKNNAIAVLVSVRSEIQSNVAACFRTHEEENKETAESARNVFLEEFMGYPDRLMEQFQNCVDDECRKQVLAEANNAIEQVNDEVWKVLIQTLAAQEALMVKFEEECLIKSEQDYQGRIKTVIETAEKCVLLF